MGRWIAIFSQTGSELDEVVQGINRIPDEVFTDGDYAGRVFQNCYTTARGCAMPKSHAEIEDWLIENAAEGDLVTLHGYLNILSPEVCNLPCTIVNGHPGLITRYPELKGRDPQEKVLKRLLDYDEIGCVLHRVTPKIDGGEILRSIHRPRTPELHSRSILYAVLHDMSVSLWIMYLKEWRI